MTWRPLGTSMVTHSMKWTETYPTLTGPAESLPGCLSMSAVMFDCDGVLVDSETLIAGILVDMTNDRGGNLTLSDALKMFQGIQLSRCAERISEYLGKNVTSDIIAEYHVRFAEAASTGLTAVRGVEELVQSVPVPTCVVSNSSREKMMFNLEVTRLSHYFSGRMYSAADLRRWKPEPDVYLYAAARLGFAPARCVAIEDSAVGVQSAAAAGLAVIGFGPPELRENGARWTCETMGEVRAIVHSLIRHRSSAGPE